MAPAKAAAPSQLKQTSRKGKKAWRKNVDISAVQEGIETARDETTKYGAPLSTIPSSAIFTTDPTHTQVPFTTALTPSPHLLSQTRKVHKPLRADEILALRSVTPALSTHSTSLAKRKQPSRAQRARLLALADGAASRVGVLSETAEAAHDAWDVDLVVDRDAVALHQDPQFDFLPRKQTVKAPVTLTRPPISQMKDGSTVPAVRAPGQVKSYNPLFAAWSENLTAEGEKEVKAEMERRSQANDTVEQHAKWAETWQTESFRMKGEFVLGMDSEEDEESEWEGFGEGPIKEEGDEQLKKKMPVRKTLVQRNKIKRRKITERDRATEQAASNRRKQDAETIGRMRDDKTGSDALVAVALDLVIETGNKTNHVDDGEELELRRRTLGNAPHPKAPLEVVLPDELRDSLRLLKPEGHLLHERYRSLLVRGKLESRKPIGQVRKKRTKTTEKYTYKDWTLD
ncbi:MAG: hypothetical protein M1814_006595 [Vezdaea aestivalis]|nr:MAG: hypothetical protein M1814_006595 [Vezdaea aestivalis]